MKKVAVLFGHRSSEHVRSIESGLWFLKNIDEKKYDVHGIYFNREGKQVSDEELAKLIPRWLADGEISICREGEQVTEELKERLVCKSAFNGKLFYENFSAYDVAIPVFHGPYGEDGTIQGLLKFMGIPFAGCGVTASVLCMDKEYAKRVTASLGIASADYLVLRKGDQLDVNLAVNRLNLPVVVKPASGGSSIGLSLCRDAGKLSAMADNAFLYDDKLILESFLTADEYAVGILGRNELCVTGAAKYPNNGSVADYEDKYGESSMPSEIPAKIPQELNEALKKLAIEIYKGLDCAGMARVDLFVDAGGKIMFNEVNTIPGFGSHGVFTKMWNAMGISDSEIIDRLIEDALA